MILGRESDVFSGGYLVVRREEQLRATHNYGSR